MKDRTAVFEDVVEKLNKKFQGRLHIHRWSVVSDQENRYSLRIQISLIKTFNLQKHSKNYWLTSKPNLRKS